MHLKNLKTNGLYENRGKCRGNNNNNNNNNNNHIDNDNENVDNVDNNKLRILVFPARNT